MVRRFVIGIFLLVLSFSIAPQQAEAQGGGKLTDVLAADGRFSVYLDALNKSNLTGAVNGMGNVTVFAPTNEAFNRMSGALRNSLFADPNGQLKNVLLNFIVPGAINTSQIHQVNSAKTSAGNTLSIAQSNGEVIINGHATLISVHPVANGIVYGTEEVILPASLRNNPPPTGGNGGGGTQPPSQPRHETASVLAWHEAEVDLGRPEDNPVYAGNHRMDYRHGMLSQASECRGVTWVLHQQSLGNGFTKVGGDSRTNPYRGDMPCGSSLPILCIKRTGAPPPIPELGSVWVEGQLGLTYPVVGNRLTSLREASNICRQQLGAGFRAVEFHEEGNSWEFWAKGPIANNTRFWVFIGDQAANPWNYAAENPFSPPGAAYNAVTVHGPAQNWAIRRGNRISYAQGTQWGRGACRGMTWTLLQQENGLARIGSDAQTNPFRGDTPCTQTLPVLCFKYEGYPTPAPTETGNYAFNWSRGQLKATAPVNGSRLNTRWQAANVCQYSFGPGWRIAQFHDGSVGDAGNGGWDYWAYGSLPTNTRFWVGIGNQPGNPWNAYGPGIR